MFAVVAALTESFTSRPVLTASTYAFVAASCAPVGFVTLVILEVLTSTVPVPLGSITTLPLLRSRIRFISGIQAEEIVKMRGRINQLVADETGQPLERVAKDTDRDYWMTVDEAIEYGIVNKIVKSIAEI